MADSSFITIDSDYLLKLCTIYDALNKQLLAMGADDARVSFHEHLGSTIGKLNEGMVLADGNSHLEALRTIEARVSLTTFCLDTFASSLQADGKDELADSLRMLTGLARKDY